MGVGASSRGAAGASAGRVLPSHPAAAPAWHGRRCSTSGWLGANRKGLADKLQYKIYMT